MANMVGTDTEGTRQEREKMYRVCLECNNGEGRRLPLGHVECPYEHGATVCLLEVGDVIGDFQIEEVLPAGDGGYAKVYCAKPLEPGYPAQVALKVAAADRRMALEQETAALSRLQEGSHQVPRMYPIRSPHQAPAISGATGQTNPYLGRAVVDVEPFYYLAIEYIPGRTLKAAIERKKGKGLGVAESLRIARSIASALSTVHSEKLMHLDVKPANVMFNEGGEAVLIDYGITVREDEMQTGWPGTAPYAPREQIKQDYPDRRADIHGLGVTLFEMLTGMLPYRGDTATALATSVLNNEPLTLGQVDHRLAYLDPALRRALAPDLEERYATIEEFMAALDAATSKKVQKKEKIVEPVKAKEVDREWDDLPPAKSRSNRKGWRGLLFGASGAALLSVLVLGVFLPPLLSNRYSPVVAARVEYTGEAFAMPPAGVSRNRGPGVVEPNSRDSIFMQDTPAIPLKWRDTNGPLKEGEYYLIEVSDSNGAVMGAVAAVVDKIQSKDGNMSINIGDNVLKEGPGIYRWRIVRVIDDNNKPKPVTWASGYGEFTWALVPTATPTSTNTPTSTDTPIPTSTPINTSTPTSTNTPAPPPTREPTEPKPTADSKNPTVVDPTRPPTKEPVKTTGPRPGTTPPTREPVKTTGPTPGTTPPTKEPPTRPPSTVSPGDTPQLPTVAPPTQPPATVPPTVGPPTVGPPTVPPVTTPTQQGPDVDATKRAEEAQAQQTARAQATETAVAIAEETANARATETAVAIAQQTANAHATETAVAIAQQTANARATETAEAKATAAEQTALAIIATNIAGGEDTATAVAATKTARAEQSRVPGPVDTPRSQPIRTGGRATDEQKSQSREMSAPATDNVCYPLVTSVSYSGRAVGAGSLNVSGDGCDEPLQVRSNTRRLTSWSLPPREHGYRRE
ncbi:MAG TPA: serine/threonine-protein kinase [Chloroflexia bacterium]|jgi:serine/threonine protein kinase